MLVGLDILETDKFTANKNMIIPLNFTAHYKYDLRRISQVYVQMHLELTSNICRRTGTYLIIVQFARCDKIYICKMLQDCS